MFGMLRRFVRAAVVSIAPYHVLLVLVQLLARTVRAVSILIAGSGRREMCLENICSGGSKPTLVAFERRLLMVALLVLQKMRLKHEALHAGLASEWLRSFIDVDCHMRL